MTNLRLKICFVFSLLGIRHGSGERVTYRHSLEQKLFEEANDLYDLSANNVFVDKSIFVEHYIRKNERVSRIIRPHGWGKSTNANMLKRFLEIELDGNGNVLPLNESVNRKLFVGGVVERLGPDGDITLKPLNVSDQPDIMQHQGQYPVIYVSFDCVTGTTFEEIEDSMKIVMSNLFRQHRYVTRNLTGREQNVFHWHMNRRLQEYDLENSLLYLSERLHEYFRKPVYVIVDDYDQPILNILLNLVTEFRSKFRTMSDKDIFVIANNSPDFERTLLLVEKLLGSCLDTNEALERGLLLGIFDLPFFEKFPALEEAPVHSVGDKLYLEQFGFTEEEVDQLMRKVSFVKNRDTIRNWYAYDFTGTVLYNPSSIRSFLAHHGRFQVYWPRPLDVVDDILSSDGTQENLQKLIDEETLTGECSTRINYNHFPIDTKILLFAGYLSPTIGMYFVTHFKVPNEEIIRIFRGKISQWVDQKAKYNVAADYMDVVAWSLCRFEMDDFKKKIEYLLTVIPNNAHNTERFHRAIVETLLFFMEQNYTIEYNRKKSGNEPNAILIGRPGLHTNAIVLDFRIFHNEKNFTAETEASFAQLINKPVIIDPREHRHLRYVLKMVLAFCKKLFNLRFQIDDVV